MPNPFDDLPAIVHAEMAADGAPSSPSEIAQDRIAQLVRDVWSASAELVRLRSEDREAATFISAQESDLWMIKFRIDALIEDIRTENNDRPLPKSQVFRLVRGTRR